MIEIFANVFVICGIVITITITIVLVMALISLIKTINEL